MAKIFTTLLVISLLVFSSTTLIHAARPNPDFRHEAMKEMSEDEVVEVDDNVNCKGLSEEECLIRRSLVAHTDYIYTQRHNRP